MNKLFQGEVRPEFSCSLINGINCMRDNRLSLYPCYQRDPVNEFIPSQLDPVYQYLSTRSSVSMCICQRDPVYYVYLSKMQCISMCLSTRSSVSMCLYQRDPVYQYVSLNEIQFINVYISTRSSVSMSISQLDPVYQCVSTRSITTNGTSPKQIPVYVFKGYWRTNILVSLYACVSSQRGPVYAWLYIFSAR